MHSTINKEHLDTSMIARFQLWYISYTKQLHENTYNKIWTIEPWPLQNNNYI